MSTSAGIGLIFGALALGLILYWGIMAAPNSAAPDTREQGARTLFQTRMGEVDQSAPGVLRLTRFDGDKPVFLISEDWYSVGNRQKELLIEAATKVWFQSRQDAGYTGDDIRKSLLIEDSSGNRVGSWDPLFGTRVLR